MPVRRSADLSGKALERVQSGVVGTVRDIVKHFRIHAFLRYCAKAELLPLPREFGFRAIPEECVNTEVLDNVAHRPDYT